MRAHVCMCKSGLILVLSYNTYVYMFICAYVYRHLVLSAYMYICIIENDILNAREKIKELEVSFRL